MDRGERIERVTAEEQEARLALHELAAERHWTQPVMFLAWLAIALVGGTRPSGVVVTALVFGALRNGGGLMGLETSIPIDLLFFIQALVIMFIAAPNLTARIIRMPFRRQTKGAPS